MTKMEMQLAEALIESEKRVLKLMQVVEKLEHESECLFKKAGHYYKELHKD